jgi:ribosomal small subunit protein bTHX
MGRGDKKTAKGKRTIGSFGVSRNKKKIKAQLKRNASTKSKAAAAVAAPAEAKPKKVAKKKADA